MSAVGFAVNIHPLTLLILVFPSCQNLLVHIQRQYFAEKHGVLLNVVDYVDLVEDDARIEDIEGGVVESARKDDVFEELQTVGVVDFLLDHDILYGDRLVKFRGYVEKLSVVRFVIWELGVIFEEVELSFVHIV
jgi:hypothetical protein